MRIDGESETFIAHALRADGFDASEDGTGRGTPIVVSTLTSNGDAHSGFRDEKGLVPVVYALGSHAGTADGDQTNRSHASGGPVGLNIQEDLAYSVRSERTQAVAGTLKSNSGGGGFGSDPSETFVPSQIGVRRLTPTECERLQGFPDHFTKVQYPRGKQAKDGPRYKAIGNSMAVPCVTWILSRILAASEPQP